MGAEVCSDVGACRSIIDILVSEGQGAWTKMSAVNWSEIGK